MHSRRNPRITARLSRGQTGGKLVLGLVSFVVAGLLGLPASAAVKVVAPTNSISADTAANGTSAAWTSLGAITITENIATDFTNGNAVTLVFAPPAGFQFNPAQTPSLAVQPGGSDLAGLSAAVASGSVTVTFTVSGHLHTDTLTIGGTTALQVQPVNGGPLAATGLILRPAGAGGGTAGIAGLLAGGGVSCGRLAETVGAFTKLQLLMPGETASAGSASGKTGTPAAQTAGVAFNIIVNSVDSYWNLVGTNDSVRLTGTDANAVGVPVTNSLAGGTKTVSVTCKTAGSQSLTAADLTRGGITAGTGASTAINAGPLAKLQVLMPGEASAPGTTTGKTGTPTAQTVGTAFNVTVNSVDANWNLISTNNSVKVVCSDLNATGVPATNSLSSGTRTFNVLCKTAGGQTVTASDLTHGSVTSNSGSSTTISAAVYAKLQLLMPGETASPGSATGKTGTPAAQTAGSAFNVTVKSVDANWNPVGAGDLVGILSSDANAILPASAALSGGIGTFAITLKTAGSRTLTATNLANSAITANTGTATSVTAGALKTLQLLMPGETAAPGTVAGKTGAPTTQTAGTAFNVTVNAVDALWNVVNTNDNVTLASIDPNATLPAGTALSGGTKALSVTFKTEGTQWVTATDATHPAVTASVGAVATVNPAAANKLTLAIQPSSTATAGTIFAQQPKVWIEDTYGNVCSNSTVTVAAVRSGGTGTLQGTTAFAAVGGVVTFTNLSHLVATNITIQFTSPGLTSATSSVVAVTAAVFTQLQVIMPGETASPGGASGKTGTPTAQTGGVAFSVIVNGVDAYWNVVNTNDSVRLVGSDTNATGVPATGALAGGTRTVSVVCNTAGSQTFTASDLTHAGITTNTGTLITINPGFVAKLQVLMPGETAAPGTATGKTGTPTPQTVGSAFNVTIRAVDTNWNLVNTNDSVRLSCTDATATGVPATNTLAAGTRTFNVVCKTAGSQTFTGADLTHAAIGPNSGASITVNTGGFTKLQLLMPGETAAPGTSTGKTGTAAAQTAGTAFTVTVNAVDANWNVIPTNDLIGILSSDANAVLPASAALVSGTKAFAITLKTAGTKTVTATDLTNPGITANTGTNTTVNAAPFYGLQVILPGETASPGSATGKTGNATAQTAGTSFSVKVNAVDHYWNSISTNDTVRITSSDANATLPPNAALVNGTNIFTVTQKTAGLQTVTAADTTHGTINSNAGTNTINAAAAIKLAFGTQPPATAIAGTIFAPQPVVWVEDTYGNICSNSTAIVTAVRLAGAGTLQGTISRQAVAGVSTFTNLSQLVATNITIQFTSAGLTPVTSSVVAVTAGPFSQLQVIMPGETASPGTVTGKTGTPAAQTAGAAFSVVVNSVDAYWNVVGTNDSLKVICSDPNATGVPVTSSLVSGTKTVTVVCNSAGSQTVTASDLTHAGITANTGTAITIGSGALAKLQVLMPGETAAPGTATGKTGTPTAQSSGVAFNVTVRAVDANWNPVSTNDSIKLTSTDPAATGVPATNILVAGLKTFNVLCKTMGNQTVTASDLTHASVTANTSAAVTIGAGAFTKLQLLMPGETAAAGTSTGKTGTPVPQTAGATFNVIVNAVDANWNIVNTNDLIRILSSDTNAVLPASATLTAGTKTFAVTLDTAGKKTVTATNLTHPAITANTSPSTTVNAAAFSGLQLIMPGETAAAGSATGKTGKPSTHSAGSAFNVTVNAVDAYWNVINTNDLVAITSSDANATLPANAALASGTKAFSITLKTQGIQTVTANDVTHPGVGPNTSPGTAVTAAAANRLAMGTQPSATATAGVTFAQQPVVWIEDSYGNICSNNTATVTATRLGGAGTLQGTTSLAAVGGVASFSNLSHLVATNITIQFASSGLTSVTSASVTVGAAPFSQLLVVMPGETASPGSATGRTGTPTTQTAGMSFNATVRAVDAYWNLISTNDNVIITASDPNAILPASAALASGIKTFAVTFKAGPSQSVIASDATHLAITANTGTPTTVRSAALAKLQMLMPGETAVAGSTTGKSGTPTAQTVGTAFNVTVNAVDAYWNVVGTNDSVKIVCSDPSAAGVPATNSLASGTTTFSVVCQTVGTQTVTASNLTHAAVTFSTGTPITISPSKLNQTITFGSLPSKAFGSAPFALTATASSGLTVSYGILSGPASVTGNTVTLTGPGLVTVQASQPGNAVYNAATSVNQSFTVTQGTPAITWTNPVDIVYGTALGGTQLNASSTVASTFNYTPLAGTVLNASNAQVLSVTLVPADPTDYNNATATVLINVARSDSTNALVSSANPALPGTMVTFTDTLAAAGTGAAPAGTVQFSTNETIAGAAVTLTNGVAAFSTALLPHGSNVITVGYPGNSNYNGSTNSLTVEQVINTPPVAGTASFSRARDVGLLIDVSDLLTNATDADGDTLTLTEVSATTTNNGTAQIISGFIFYNPPAANGNATDRFTYTVADSFGGTATGTAVVMLAADSGNQTQNILGIQMTNGMSLISFAGIPGQTYYIQAVAALPPSNLWLTIGTNVAGTNGLFQFLDADASNYPSRYYRTAVP